MGKGPTQYRGKPRGTPPSTGAFLFKRKAIVRAVRGVLAYWHWQQAQR